MTNTKLENQLCPKKLRIISYFLHGKESSEFNVYVYQSPHSSVVAREYMEEFLKATNQDASLYSEFQALYAVWAGHTTLRKVATKHFSISANGSKNPSATIKFKIKHTKQFVPWSQRSAIGIEGLLEYETGRWTSPRFWGQYDRAGSQAFADKLCALTPELES